MKRETKTGTGMGWIMALMALMGTLVASAAPPPSSLNTSIPPGWSVTFREGSRATKVVTVHGGSVLGVEASKKYVGYKDKVNGTWRAKYAEWYGGPTNVFVDEIISNPMSDRVSYYLQPIEAYLEDISKRRLLHRNVSRRTDYIYEETSTATTLVEVTAPTNGRALITILIPYTVWTTIPDEFGRFKKVRNSYGRIMTLWYPEHFNPISGVSIPTRIVNLDAVAQTDREPNTECSRNYAPPPLVFVTRLPSFP